MGNLTRDPETRVTPNGTAICKIGLAINRKWRDASGEIREDVTFVDCDSFAHTANAIQKYTHKGDMILVEGRLKLDQWDDKTTGEKRSRHGVVIESAQFLGGRSEGEATSAPSKPVTTHPARPTPQLDDDVPF
jgi:single-strand DNA-binding protein